MQASRANQIKLDQSNSVKKCQDVNGPSCNRDKHEISRGSTELRERRTSDITYCCLHPTPSGVSKNVSNLLSSVVLFQC